MVLPIKMPCVRPFIVVSQTTLRDPETGERYPFNGLFAGQAIPKGGFIGFYSGDFKDGHYTGKAGAYIFQMSDMYITPKRRGKTISSFEYPLAMCNEPAPGTMANVTQHEFTKAKDVNGWVIPQLNKSTKIAALGFYACRNIKAGEELFLHYGNKYNRNHYKSIPGNDIVGQPCTLKKEFKEMPLTMMLTYGLHPFVPEDCFREYE